MAQNSIDFTIRIDSADAQKQLDEVNQKAQEVAEEASRVTGDGTPSAKPSQGGGGGTAPTLPQVPTVDTSKAQAERLGETAGKAIGQFFVSHLLSKGVDLAIDSSRSALTSNNTQNAIEAGVGGAIAGAGAGAIAGSFLPGVGTVIGAIVGGLSSGILGLGKELSKQRQERELAERNVEGVGILADRQRYISKENLREASLMSFMPSIAEKQKYISGRLTELNDGNGRNDLQVLRNELLSLVRANKQDSKEYEGVMGRYQLQMSRYNNYSLMDESLEAEKIQYLKDNFFSAGEATDTLASQGLFVGNNVNVDTVNQRQLTVLEEIRDSLKSKIAPADTASIPGTGSAYGY